MGNWYLTGMPGSGKSTLGRALSEKLGCRFCDLDEAIVRRTGQTIPHLFAQRGEDGFREAETAALREVATESGLVVSTGGGAILRLENVDCMQKSGRILFVDRPLDCLLQDIEVQGRPLLAEGEAAVRRLYHTRYALYLERCDLRIENEAGPAAALERLLAAVKALEGALLE
jgi:shikimate kinase